jgi:uncharacterized membrane protein
MIGPKATFLTQILDPKFNEFGLSCGEIFAYNLFVLINYVLTGAIAYALCFYCTGHDRGSVLGALIYTFSANR